MGREARRLPGNVVVRRPRRRSETVAVQTRGRRSFTPRPWMVPAAFAVAIAFGGLLLSLPITSESGEWTNGWDAVFTSASAVCVTGLSRFDTSEHFNFLGELVIALLIQIGGLGVTMYAGMLMLLVGGQFGLRGREFFGIELMGVTERDVRQLLRRAAAFTIVVEAATFLLLLPWSLAEWGVASGTWHAFFHAISAFNNAGFDLMGGGRGFTGQIEDPYPITVMGVSAFLGSLSFITAFDLRHRPRRWTLDTKLVVVGMVVLQVAGMIMFLVAEVQPGHVLEDLGAIDLLANSFFLTANRTTGMATVDMGAMQDANVVVLLVLMFIGASSTSTAGGIKMGAFMVSVVVVLSAIRGHHRAQAFGHENPAGDRAARDRGDAPWLPHVVCRAVVRRADRRPALPADAVRGDVGARERRLVARLDRRALDGRRYGDRGADVPRAARAAGGRPLYSRPSAGTLPLFLRPSTDRLAERSARGEERTMQIAVLGLGRFGSQLTESLAGLGHEVLAIDLNDSLVQRVAPHCAKAAVADITDEQALRDLGAGAVEAAVVATGHLESSVLAVMNVQSLEVPSVYAKASTPLHARILERIGVRRVVQPEREGGERFAHLIRVQGARDYLSLSADYGIGVYPAPPHLEGKPLRVLDSENTTRRLLMVVRGNEVELNPVRDRPIAKGDGLVFAGKDNDLARSF